MKERGPENVQDLNLIITGVCARTLENTVQSHAKDARKDLTLAGRLRVVPLALALTFAVAP